MVDDTLWPGTHGGYEVEEDKVEANFKDGILKLSMPIKASSKSRKIEIKQ